jgi:AcrR family transcriptional regulator
MSPRSESANQAIREKRRTSIIEAAIDVFSSHGYHSATINSIARQAGISKGLVYSYFESKDSLLNSILHEVIDESAELVTQILAAKTTREKVLIMLQISFDYIEERPKLMRLLLGLSLQPEAVMVIQGQVGERTKEMMGFLEQLLHSAGIPAVKEETYLLGAALDGMALHYLFFINDPDYPWQKIKATFIENTLKHFNL